MKMAIKDSPFSGDRQKKILEMFDEVLLVDDLCRWLSMLQAGEWYKVADELAPVSSEEGMLWADRFAGNALEALVSRLKSAEANFLENEQSAKNKLFSRVQYVKSINVVQSTGMGKSRLVSQLGKKMMTISFVLRYPGQTGFPPGDKEVFEFLLKGNGFDTQQTHERAVCFLSATFFVGRYSSILSDCQADLAYSEELVPFYRKGLAQV